MAWDKQFWKESLNSDVKKFQRYQQTNNHLISNHLLRLRKTMTYDAGIQGPVIGHAHRCSGVS